ncbi:hypothetical protein [Novosphingobium sp.]|uniref:hypothetical protein n=1 Tax=Novosphingobium sp. TaxID=1874826 RepID=UPI0028AA38AB|nr:hypothetical protein [Novosphingobium sp.]
MHFHQGSDSGSKAAAIVFRAAELIPAFWETTPVCDPRLILTPGIELRSAPAILQYQAAQARKFKPQDQAHTLRISEWLNYLLTEIDYSGRPLAAKVEDGASLERLAQSQSNKWTFLLQNIEATRFLAGTALSVADVYLLACLFHLESPSLLKIFSKYTANISAELTGTSGDDAEAIVREWTRP